ncbi:sigma-70 family RNA polymerase sigma factor [Haliscomenobacter sp.]|uniref:RNA polymerase sigma factor n=1 Tax=Haliscomenobacter sp. TaxID=2717303 RepID=UPI003364E373
MSEKNTILSTVRRYGSKLFRFIRGRVRSEEEAEDILQDVWVQLSRLSNLEEVESISAWLYQVARNRITDTYRKKSTESLDDLAFEDEDGNLDFKEILLSDSQSPEDAFFKEIFWDALMQALDELPENQRQVFVWNELEDLTLQEIADKTNENLKTIISRKRYAVQHLRQRLQALYDELNNA